jgi:hypothetical protein
MFIFKTYVCIILTSIIFLPIDYCRGNHVPNNGERQKRALDSRDDDIDDQDVIPPYNPPIRNITVLSWPTPSGLTEENATEICNRRIRYSKAGESCGAVAGVDLDALVGQCISDIQVHRKNIIRKHDKA